MRRAIAMALTVLALFGAGPVAAQQVTNPPIGQLEPGAVISPILTIDRDRVFRDSAFGKRVLAENEERRVRQDEDDKAVAAALEAEEAEITQKRPSLDAEAFRDLADAFDAKVQETEQAQFAKRRLLEEQFESERLQFLEQLDPVLQRIVIESNALIVLDRRVVLAGVAQIDITDRAVALLDETIGTGVAPE